MTVNRPDWGLRPQDTDRLYPEDPDGPETLAEACQALHDALVDLWGMTGLPVAQAAADKLQAGVDTWRDWWKPMDLSGHWTKGWTPDETLLEMIGRKLHEAFRRAFDGTRGGKDLHGIQGMRPAFTVQDEIVQPGGMGDALRYSLVPGLGSLGQAFPHHLFRDTIAQAAAIEVIKVKAERVGLDWDDIVRRAREDPRDGTESEAIRRAYETAMDEGIRDGTIEVHEPRGFLDFAIFDPADFIKVDPAVPPGVIATGLTPDQMARYREEIPFPQAETNRAFQDATTGEWMTDDEDEDR